MIGTIIGNYKITEKIGEGGMGAVFKGLDEMLEREVAIKMLRPELARQPEVVERFRTEAVTLAKLNHPNIATLYSFLRQNNDYFMVMEYVRGNTLESVLRNFGAIPYERAVPLFCQALEGIDHAHKQGIIHRDIKPANVMVMESNTVKVMDFGIARVLGSARMTRQGNVVGTVEYMSPEQIRGEETDTRADIYSLGILLYEMLTGRVPFESPSEYELMKRQVEEAPPPPTQFAAHLPVLIEQAIMRALAKKPEARFKTAGEFRSVLLGTLSAITGQLGISTTANYAAPATRIDQMGLRETQKGTLVAGVLNPSVEIPQRSSGEAVRSDSGGTQAFASSSNSQQVAAPTNSKEHQEPLTSPFSGQPRSTGTQVIHATPPNAQPTLPQQPPTPATSTLESQSLFGKLNWKHYTAAAVLLVALLSVPLALTLRKGGEPAAPPAAVEGQEQPAVAEEPVPEQNPLPASTEVQEAGADVLTEAGNANSNSADANKAARARRGEKTEEEAATSGEAEAKPADASAPPPTQPAQTTEPQPSTENKAAAANKEPEKATEPAKKEEKKKGGIGGFFKKVFGGGEKKETKKKESKKPNN